jgi:hypothetical protein
VHQSTQSDTLDVREYTAWLACVNGEVAYLASSAHGPNRVRRIDTRVRI